MRGAGEKVRELSAISGLCCNIPCALFILPQWRKSALSLSRRAFASQAKVVFPASRTIVSAPRLCLCATACWQADVGPHLHFGQGLRLHRFQIVYAHGLASRALLLFFVRCCCLLRVQRHTERMSRGAREGMADTGASTSERKGQQRARGNGGTPCP